MYSLPNVHKVGISFRPILVYGGLGAAQIGKMIGYCNQFQICNLLFVPCIHFCFSKFIRDSDWGSVDKLMVLLDIVSLFINVPIQETLQICTDTL